MAGCSHIGVPGLWAAYAFTSWADAHTLPADPHIHVSAYTQIYPHERNPQLQTLQEETACSVPILIWEIIPTNYCNKDFDNMPSDDSAEATPSIHKGALLSRQSLAHSRGHCH